ncbi:MAG: hypothetical protein Q9M28_03500, partial [Mariprofundaceae bacterium]|nr:hypothetical protein [Mariprofundaceae bacterium]
MSRIKPELPEIKVEEHSPLIKVMLELIAYQQFEIEILQQEILKLKGETTKPDVKPSKMDDDSTNNGNGSSDKKPKKPRRKKTKKLKIHHSRNIQPEHIPEGSVFKGYKPVVVQDIIFQVSNTCYRLAQYQTPDGSYVSGQLPTELQGKHFDRTLIAYILHQYHHQHV